MKYSGLNKEGFDRDARSLNEWIAYANPSDDEIADAAHDLADAFGIPRAEIWDYLPEYAE